MNLATGANSQELGIKLFPNSLVLYRVPQNEAQSPSKCHAIQLFLYYDIFISRPVAAHVAAMDRRDIYVSVVTSLNTWFGSKASLIWASIKVRFRLCEN